jgi:hypothetical protein
LNDNLDETIISTKRKRPIPNGTNGIESRELNKSLSQLSISQGSLKKTKVDNSLKIQNEQQQQHEEIEEEENQPSSCVMSRSIPQYLRVSNLIFKQMLSTTTKDGDQIVQWLDIDEKIKLIRQITELVNFSCYVKTQQLLWQVYNIVGRAANWPAPKSNEIAKQHNTCRILGRPKKLVEQRLKTIEHQLQRTNNELEPLWMRLLQWTDQANLPISSITLRTAIETLVKTGQHRLYMEFDHRKMMLILDANDHQLITAFYALNPNEDQVCLKVDYFNDDDHDR